MRGKVFSLLYLALFVSCTKETPLINTVCELIPNGTYLIKWETFPPMKGTVKIYESDRPDSFNLYSPIFELDIEDGYKRVLAMPAATRTYFKLVFNKKYSVITTNRIVPLQGIFNFRDLGGYYSKGNKQLLWGKLYRSGSLALATKHDRRFLDKMGIETVIDLRTERESYSFPNKYKAPQIYNLPLRGNRYDIFFDEILSQKMKRRDILIYDQNVFSFLLENNTDYFIKMFDILLEESNYPVIIFCSLGKDRTAIASTLILAALGVDDETIMEDYLLSNNLINYHSLVQNADLYPFEVQETITALFSAQKETIKYSMELLKDNYGSIENYLEKELKLTHRKREKLKNLLLYPAE
ncbi:MAG: tyrosine-protein phosphatase [Dysgonamonadaceae bacterium]|jgi:protein-tyrosine phosphatase|nr:tyrosine-protein phosphatase [Dysgonamonadaceae bacterium]